MKANFVKLHIQMVTTKGNVKLITLSAVSLACISVRILPLIASGFIVEL